MAADTGRPVRVLEDEIALGASPNVNGACDLRNEDLAVSRASGIGVTVFIT
jgi:hypothetical protein